MNWLLTAGVNDYAHISPLRGCVSDMADMYGTIRGLFGNFSPTELANSMATKARILSSLAAELSSSAPGDRLFVHFSGHGTQVRSETEADGFDEVLCPYDFDPKRPRETGIVDDELSGVLSTAPARVCVELIIDACHSGTVTRGIKPELRVRPRFFKSQDVGSKPMRRIRQAVERGRPLEGVTAWTACRDDQTAAEILTTEGYRGAFTKAWCATFRAEPVIKRGDFLKVVRGRVKRLGLDQIPQVW